MLASHLATSDGGIDIVTNIWKERSKRSKKTGGIWCQIFEGFRDVLDSSWEGSAEIFTNHPTPLISVQSHGLPSWTEVTYRQCELEQWWGQDFMRGPSDLCLTSIRVR